MVLSALQAVPFCSMSRRIDIELTSALGDGTWTWRAAGAKQPKGVVAGSVLAADAKVGDELKVEVEQEIDGITVLGIVQARDKAAPSLVELLPVERDFQPVLETRAKRDRNERGGRDGDRRPRRDRDDRGPGRGRDGRRPGGGRGDGRGDSRGRDGGDGDGRRGEGGRGDGRRGEGGRGHRGASFTPPPEVPQRPKARRLRPGKAHRNMVLAELPEEQRAVAELALQGMGAVRQRVREENDKAVAEGRPPMPEATVMKMAEELIPKLRLAEWSDRAEAAQRQIENLDLRDLRSVIAASGDPAVARDDGSNQLVAELKEALVHKQEQELRLWFGDIDAALAVGRVIRALRLSSQPPKAGVPFPVDIAKRLADSVNASLAPMDSTERWSAMLEAAAFSPVRLLIKPIRKPDVVNDELLATVKRLAPALPQIAALFEVEADPNASMPKPLRPNMRQNKDGGSKDSNRKDSNRKDSDAGGAKKRKPKRTDSPAAGAVTESTVEPLAETPSESPAPTKSSAAQETPVAAEPAAEIPSESAAEAVTEAVAEIPSESVAEAVTETSSESVGEAVTEAVAETSSESVAEAVAETPSEPVAQAVAETPSEAVAETATETANEDDDPAAD